MVTETDLETAYGHSRRHRPEIEASRECGCFHCCRVFPASRVAEWLEEQEGGQTAFCPECETDAILGDASGLPVTDPSFLAAMHRHWFPEGSAA